MAYYVSKFAIFSRNREARSRSIGLVLPGYDNVIYFDKK